MKISLLRSQEKFSTEKVQAFRKLLKKPREPDQLCFPDSFNIYKLEYALGRQFPAKT